MQTKPEGARRSAWDSDPVLLDRARRFEPEAWRDIHERSFDRVYSFVSRLTPGSDRVERLTSAAFARAMHTLASYRDRELGIDPWLIRCAYEVVSESRIRAVRRVEPDPVRAAFWRLPDRERSIVAYRVLAGLNLAETQAASRLPRWLLVLVERRALNRLSRLQAAETAQKAEERHRLVAE
jgi:DNA-directed RNA polymerase specialized sigma24 family protein